MSYSNPMEQLYPEELYDLPQKVLIVIPVTWDALPESDKVLLERILNFTKRNLSSVQVLSLKEVETESLIIYRPSRIIAFGSDIKVSGKSIQPYQAYASDQVVVLRSDRLGELDEPKKKILRDALKGMFQGAGAWNSFCV